MQNGWGRGETKGQRETCELTQVRSDQGSDQVRILGNHPGEYQLFFSSPVLSPSLEMKPVALATRVDAFDVLSHFF